MTFPASDGPGDKDRQNGEETSSVQSEALASVTVVTVITEKATSLELHKSFESTVGPVLNDKDSNDSKSEHEDSEEVEDDDDSVVEEEDFTCPPWLPKGNRKMPSGAAKTLKRPPPQPSPRQPETSPNKKAKTTTTEPQISETVSEGTKVEGRKVSEVAEIPLASNSEVAKNPNDSKEAENLRKSWRKCQP